MPSTCKKRSSERRAVTDGFHPSQDYAGDIARTKPVASLGADPVGTNAPIWRSRASQNSEKVRQRFHRPVGRVLGIATGHEEVPYVRRC